jgi:hypothetical protein
MELTELFFLFRVFRVSVLIETPCELQVHDTVLEFVKLAVKTFGIQ